VVTVYVHHDLVIVWRSSMVSAAVVQ
jgi:hypothetical protein